MSQYHNAPFDSELIGPEVISSSFTCSPAAEDRMVQALLPLLMKTAVDISVKDQEACIAETIWHYRGLAGTANLPLETSEYRVV